MIHARQHDLVPRLQITAQGAADRKGQRGHVGAEDDLIRGGRVEQVGHGRVRILQDHVAALGGEKRAAAVGVGMGQIVSHGVDDALRNLCAAWVVQKNRWPAVHLHGQGRKSSTDVVEIKHDGVGILFWQDAKSCHASRLPCISTGSSRVARSM